MMLSKKKLALVAVLMFVAVLAAVFIFLPRQFAEDPLPNPNGYDDFMKAAVIITGDSSEWPDLTVEELRSMFATNQPAFTLVRTGLTKECRVAPYSTVSTTNDHFSDLAASKRVAQAFVAASRLASLDGRTNEAALLVLDCIRYGHESTRGGVLIDGWVGLAVQTIGLARLEEALPGTDADTSRKVAATLEDVASKRESVDAIFKREAQWARRGRFGPAGFFEQLFRPFLLRGMKAKTEQKFSQGSIGLQKTKIHAAVHAYELDHGKPPAAAHDLVPQYLKFAPLDPATGQEPSLN